MPCWYDGELENTPKECMLVTKNGERLRKTGGLRYSRLRERWLNQRFS